MHSTNEVCQKAMAATEDHTMGEASQTPAKRARIDTSGATAKRPRDEATADTLAPAAAAMASALNDLKRRRRPSSRSCASSRRS